MDKTGRSVFAAAAFAAAALLMAGSVQNAYSLSTVVLRSGSVNIPRGSSGLLNAPNVTADSLVFFTVKGKSEKIDFRHLKNVRRMASHSLGRKARLDSLTSLRKTLERLALKSKRGKVSMEMTDVVLDALSSDNLEEYHNKLAVLPITVAEVKVGMEEGVATYRRDYYVRGVRKASMYSTVREARPQLESIVEESGGSDNLTEYADASITKEATPDYCEYTDPYNVFWSGDCASQQEKDDAVAVIIALDTDVQNLVDEQNGIVWCSQNPIPGCYYDQEEYDANPLSVQSRTRESVAGPYAEDTPFWESVEHPRSCDAGTPFAQSNPFSYSCATEAGFAAIGVASWVGSKYALMTLVSAASVTTGGVAWGVFAAATAGAAAAFGVAGYLSCVYQQ